MGESTPASFTIDIDTGGTFTDGYVSGPGIGVQAKADTTPHDLTLGIIGCIDRAAVLLGMDRRGLLGRTETVRLSTTVSTNALINRTGPKVGVLLAQSLHDLIAENLPEQVPVERELVAAVPDNAVSGDAAMAAAKRLLERGARLIVVALVDDDLSASETALRERIAVEYPRHYLGAVPVLASHEVSLTPDASSRVRTAILNAYLHPLMARFLYRVEDELRRSGYRHPLLIGNADGGTTRVAKTTAIRTWGSGPAGGVAGAAYLARLLDVPNLMTVDVGGTTSDIALVANGEWRYVVQPSVAGASVAVPLLELESLGVGGGSIVRVSGGELTVGPDSAGAQPGPAAFGLGGENPTVTDAFCVVGVMDPANFLGGRKKLDVDAAHRVFKSLAGELHSDTVPTAEAAITTAARNLAGGIKDSLRLRGVDPATVELLVGGGAGGLLGCYAAAAAGLRAVRAFPLAPVFSAYGLSVLDRLHSYELLPGADLADRIGGVIERARTDMQTEGIDPGALRFELEAETGPDDAVVAERLGEVTAGTDAAQLVDASTEVPRLVRIRAIAPTNAAPPQRAEAADAATTDPRRATWDGTERETTIVRWPTLHDGQSVAGPTVIEGDDTTFVLPPGFTATVGRYGDLYINTAPLAAGTGA